MDNLYSVSSTIQSQIVKMFKENWISQDDLYKYLLPDKVTAMTRLILDRLSGEVSRLPTLKGFWEPLDNFLFLINHLSDLVTGVHCGPAGFDNLTCLLFAGREPDTLQPPHWVPVSAVCRGLWRLRGQLPLHCLPQHGPQVHPARPTVRHHRVPASGGPLHLQVQPPQGYQGCQSGPTENNHPRGLLHLQHGRTQTGQTSISNLSKQILAFPSFKLHRHKFIDWRNPTLDWWRFKFKYLFLQWPDRSKKV